ncbi:hypothetical protein SDC9_166781 [bioreactor metagenome]|uniref:Carboxymuconolactone decarboxylase-like domain-containing protein n=1 Tax=bioreactor metagenome TaxID=1076179 RepID=A0A645G0E2_9ZZZZ
MLAVTEVNRCAVCSYAHTRMALESGMNSAEIAGILNCQWDDVPADELKGLLFAQHYAESRGQPSAGSWAMVNENYGVDKALKILAVIRIIMIGNVYGIAYGSFIKRFKGHPDPRSTLFYELTVMILGVLILPIAAVQALLANLFRIPWIKIQI